MTFNENYILAILTLLTIAIAIPIIGNYLFYHNLSSLPDALAHFSLTGISFGYLLNALKVTNNISPMVANIFYVVFIGMILFINSKSNKNSTAIQSTLMAISMSITSIILTTRGVSGVNIESFLFGSIVIIKPYEFIIVLVSSILMLSFYFVYRRKIYLLLFSRIQAKIMYNNIEKIDNMFFGIIVFVIAATIPIVGVLIFTIFISMPILIARLISKSYKDQIIKSIIVSVSAVSISNIIALYVDINKNAIISITLTIIYFFISIITRRKNGK